MRAVLIAALLAAPALAKEGHGHGDAINNYTLVEEADITRFDGQWVANWEVQGWIGSDMNK
jgi:copper resistance protein B